MAIKKNVGPVVPATLDKLVTEAAREQQITDFHDAKFKGVKAEIVSYLDGNKDGFDCVMSEGVECSNASFTYGSRKSWKIDKDKLGALVAANVTTMQSILNIGSFKPEDLQKLLTKEQFESLATFTESNSLTIRAKSTFKAEVLAECEGGEGGVPNFTPPAPVAVVAKAEPKAAPKAKAAKSAEDELTDIIGGK